MNPIPALGLKGQPSLLYSLYDSAPLDGKNEPSQPKFGFAEDAFPCFAGDNDTSDILATVSVTRLERLIPALEIDERSLTRMPKHSTPLPQGTGIPPWLDNESLILHRWHIILPMAV